MLESVRMLCTRSAIFIKMTRTSSLIMSKSFLNVSACNEAFSPKIPPEIFVSPSTIFPTFGPKRFVRSSLV